MSLPNGVCDEILEDGTEIRRVGKVVLDGSEYWHYSGDHVSSDEYKCFHTKLSDFSKVGSNNVGMCDVLPVTLVTSPLYLGEGVTPSSNYNVIYIKLKMKVTSISGAKQWLSQNPVTVYYELAEPVIIKHNKNINLKTFEGTTHIVSENYLPATITAKVPSNVNAVVMSLKEENKALTLENEKLNNELNITNENLETLSVEQGDYIFDNDYRITMLELGLA